MRAHYRVGFEIVHRNDDNTRIVGIFVFRVSKELYFAPVFFINGAIKGTDLFYRHNRKAFVPLNEGWLEYLISLSETQEGEGVPVSERINTRRQMNLQAISTPPTTMGGGYKYASDATIDPAEVRQLAHEAWDSIKSAGIPALPEESILRKFITESGGFDSIRKIAAAAKSDPDFAEALMLGSEPANYMPELDAPKQASAISDPLLVLHENVLANENCKTASEKSILNGYEIMDKRAAETLNEDVFEPYQRDIQSITSPGVHEVLLANGKMQEMICGYHHYVLRGSDPTTPSPDLVPRPSARSIPFILVDCDTRHSLDLDLLPDSRAFRVVGKPKRDLNDQDGEAKPEANKMYRLLNLKHRSLSEPLWVKSIKSTELGLTQVEVCGEYSSAPKFITLNPDYNDFDQVELVAGKCCRWVPIAHREDSQNISSNSYKVADDNIKVGDLHALQEFIFAQGFRKAAVDYRQGEYLVRLNADQRNSPAALLNKVAAKLAIMAPFLVICDPCLMDYLAR